MAASTTASFPVAASEPRAFTAGKRPSRRLITPQAGQALVILGHAIEYLADEFVHRGVSFSSNDAQLEAMQMLMALNREIYFECREIPSLAQRCRSFLHLPQA